MRLVLYILQEICTYEEIKQVLTLNPVTLKIIISLYIEYALVHTSVVCSITVNK